MEKDVTCREVVITANATRGKGVIGSPIRRIIEVWEKDGTKIAEHDPMPELLTYTDAIDFAKWCQSRDCPSGPLRMDMLDKWLEATRSLFSHCRQRSAGCGRGSAWPTTCCYGLAYPFGNPW